MTVARKVRIRAVSAIQYTQPQSYWRIRNSSTLTNGVLNFMALWGRTLNNNNNTFDSSMANGQNEVACVALTRWRWQCRWQWNGQTCKRTEHLHYHYCYRVPETTTDQTKSEWNWSVSIVFFVWTMDDDDVTERADEQARSVADNNDADETSRPERAVCLNDKS